MQNLLEAQPKKPLAFSVLFELSKCIHNLTIRTLRLETIILLHSMQTQVVLVKKEFVTTVSG